MIPALVILLLSTVAIGVAFFSQQWVLMQAAKTAPGEGFYWSVTQYQLAYLLLSQDLRAIAAGESIQPQTLARRSAVLASRASILTEPSEVRQMLKQVAGFDEATRRIAALHSRINPLLVEAGLTPAGAEQVLAVFRAADVDTLLSQLGNDARQAEILAKEDLLRSLIRRMAWVWIGFGLCWAVLALWLLHAVQSSRRFALVAAEREQALSAMAEAVDSKRRFLGMVSHELRSPLQSIVTATESLSRDVALGNSRPQSAAAIRRTWQAISSLQAQLRDLLTMAHRGATELALQPEIFECSELVRDVCADFEDAALAKGLGLQVKLPFTHQTVSADPVRIAQVVRNLLQNAVRYTSDGRVEVELFDTASQSAPTPNRSMRFTISDTGPGMPDAIIARLQSRTEPVLPGSDAPLEGMHIGLFIIRDVLHQLGGHIAVLSETGKGTVVTVEIPVVASTQIAGNDAREDLDSQGGTTGTAAAPTARDVSRILNVLIVDDQPAVLNDLREAVRHLGHDCDVAASAQAAEALIAQSLYDTVLIDLEMPGRSGLALARDIRSGFSDRVEGWAKSRNAESMLIMISASENRDAGLRAPFDGYLQKPISSDDLHQLIGSRTRR